MKKMFQITIPPGWVRGFLIALAVAFLLTLGGTLFSVDRLSRDLPPVSALQTIEPAVKTVIFSAGGDTLREFFTENRTLVPLNRIPRSLQEAVISVEDRRFRQHYGLDMRRLLQVIWTNLSTDRSPGASTLTQQLARNLFLNPEKGYLSQSFLDSLEYGTGDYIGSITDSLSALKTHVFENRSVAMKDLLEGLKTNFKNNEALRLKLWNKTPFFGNDDDRADALMQRVYASLFKAIDGKPNTKGSEYHLNMLSTTCHIYFGKMLGATPNGRFAELPISDGTSPSHGADRNGPTAVVKSLGKMDQVKSGGTLLNQRFLPEVLEKEKDLDKLVQLIRTYFRLNGHHIQFNIVDTDTLKKAQAAPDEYRDLLVRVAGYSDYFVDLDEYHQQEIINRTTQKGF